MTTQAPATAAIFHHPDVVESADKPLAGRRTAGQSFLAGYTRHMVGDRLSVAAATQAHLDHFCDLAKANGWRGKVDRMLTSNTTGLGRAGVLMLPGPTVGKYAWVRRRGGQRLYSICGITHTVSTRRIMEGLLDSAVAPVEEWDAIICTSRAVQQVIATELDEAETYLRRRFAAGRVPRPQLPVIPLGIDTAAFARDGAARAHWRKTHGIGENDLAVMSMGRLSVFEKMHPAPLYIALQRAAEETGATLHLMMVGWFANDSAEALHRDAAAALAPSVTVHFPDGKDEALRYQIWSAADIFALPVDNIQETFGLAPVEAMAAGLPVVCSDWNGFRDTVDHGVTGFRVRTLMSRPGYGQRIAARFEDNADGYHQYLGFVHQRTTVDVPEMAEAFAALIRDPGKRAAMGAAGRTRARQLYDWAAVIPQYQALWADLNARRDRGLPTSGREQEDAANPAAMDPFTLYRGYPTGVLPVTALLSAERTVTEAEIDQLITLTGGKAIHRIVAKAPHIADLLALIHAQGQIRLDAVQDATELDPATAEGVVLWLAKYDLIRVEM
ncbi:MAG: glycosyltransferase family 4 protein [Pseudomonadota bacterium]